MQTAFYYIAIPALGLVPTNTTTFGSDGFATEFQNVNWTYLTWLSLGYYSCRGGVRYKIVPLEGPTILTTWPDVGLLGLLTNAQSTSGFAYNITSSTGLAINVFDVDPIAEVELPMKIIQNFRPAYRQVQTPNSTTVGETLCITDQDGNYNYMLFQAGADDFTYGKYLFPPVLNTTVVIA